MPWPLIAGIGMMALGGVGKAIGSIMGGNQEAQIAEYNAQVSELKAKQAEYQAEFGMYQAKAHRALVDEQLRRKREEVEGTAASQKVSAAYRGVQGSISAMEQELDTLTKGALDAEMIGWKGDVEAKAKAYESRLKGHQAEVLLAEADWQREQGRQAKKGGIFGAVTSLLGFGAQAGGVLSQYNFSSKTPDD